MSTSPPPATSTYSSLDMALGSKPALRPSTCDNVPNATPHDAMPLPQKTSDTGCLHQKRSIDFDNNEEGDRKRMRLMTDNTDAGGDPPLDAALARTGCIDAECGQEDQCVYEAETDDANASLAEGQSADADADTDSDSDSDSDASSVASTTDEVEPYPVLETAESEEISIYADGHVEGDRAHTLVNCRVRRSSMDLWHERMITIIYARSRYYKPDICMQEYILALPWASQGGGSCSHVDLLRIPSPPWPLPPRLQSGDEGWVPCYERSKIGPSRLRYEMADIGVVEDPS